MTKSRFVPDWRRVGRGAAVGCAATGVVGLLAYGGVSLIGSQAGGDVVGANIGLGIGAMALRLVVTPLVGWWLLRLLKVPRAGLATVLGLVCYLILAPLGWGDPALPGVARAWLVLGGLSGAIGVYAAGCIRPRGRAAST
ncbi:hypothetical protein [Streptomonospora litoralis]|uniref:Uncharacterized protein n=1 Tax=Streptomonospora litoralis TaxID=2498135 RepID=A0A4V0ZJV1_9ACTN|nr:hypothetical protein [Streptomonospora litoralis]QBI54762.1 hypothetical protein EKD16_14920 [Streptomonospora litoralis]